MSGGRVVAVVGTDTEVGKTFVVRALLAGARAAGVSARPLKPFATGADGKTDDGAVLAREAGLPLEAVSPVRMTPPLSPHAAVRRRLADPIDWTAVEAARASARAEADLVLVEGIGGVACPIEEGVTWLDVHARWGDDAVLVARAGLGTLSATLLALEALARRGIERLALVLSEGGAPSPGEPGDDPSREDNAEILAAWTGLPTVRLPKTTPEDAARALLPVLDLVRTTETAAR